MAPILITLLTGFLGSGKTTLLNRLLKAPDLMGAMVVVNEFGEIGIDGDLMTGSTENIVQLANGCLCCSVKSDLIDTLRDLVIQRQAGTLPQFKRVIIETTGIADPIPVLEIILTNPMVRNAYLLDGVITVVDAVNGMQTLANFPESVRQVAIADRVILTKCDLERSTAPLSTFVRTLNPGAPILEALNGTIDFELLFGTGITTNAKSLDLERWLSGTGAEFTPPKKSVPASDQDAQYARQGHTASNSEEHQHDENITSFCVVREKPISLHALELFLEAIARQAGPKLLRVKGLINVAGEARPAVVQGAQKIFHSLDWLDRWPGEDRRTRIVFITYGLQKAQMDDDLALIERVAERTAAAGLLGAA